MIREQRATIEGLRGDLTAALREVKHQAELAVRLTIWMCRNDYANEAAEIVGKEAVEAIVKTLPAEAVDKCYD